jgi:hypothetical protein
MTFAGGFWIATGEELFDEDDDEPYLSAYVLPPPPQMP